MNKFLSNSCTIGNTRPVLSVVVPTLMREHLLGPTLQLLCKQVENYKNRVEIIVAGNQAGSQTETAIKKICERFHFLQFYDFPDRVEIDQSFQRSALLAQGEWIWVFGDDDYPLCGAIAYLLRMIDTYPDVDFIHFEVLNADAQIRKGHFRFTLPDFHEHRFSMKEIIQNVLTRPALITSFLTRRNHWVGDFDFHRYEGYGFLAMIYQHVFEKYGLLCPEPLAIQRASSSIWKPKWPRMLLLTNARTINDLPWTEDEKFAVMDKWRKSFTVKGILYTTVQAISSGFTKTNEWKESLGYQTLKLRILAYTVSNIVPKFLANFILSIIARKKATQN